MKEIYCDNLSSKKALALSVVAVCIGILYSICFSRIIIFPVISFTIFCDITFIVLWYVMKRMHLIKNKKAYIWGGPIFILSLYHGIFSVSLYSYINILCMHCLFAIFVLRVSCDEEESIGSAWFLKKMFFMIIGQWSVASGVFKRAFKTKENEEQAYKIVPKIITGITIAIPFMIILMTLLLQADQVFKTIISKINFSVNTVGNIVVYGITIVIVTIYFIGYIYHISSLHLKSRTEFKPISIDSVIGATFLVCVNLLFFIFTIVQFIFLFTGGFMKLPEGIVYSEYAREGFFQLLFVTCINFGIILSFALFVEQKKIIGIVKWLLIMLCSFTGVLIASSFYRMFLYISACGYTTLRSRVVTFLIMEAFLVIVAILFLLGRKIDLGKYCIISIVVFFLIVNVSASDYVTTKLNVERLKSSEEKKLEMKDVGLDGLGVIADFCNTEEFASGQYKIAIYIGDKKKVLKSNNVDAVLSKEYQELSYGNNHWQNWSLLQAITQGKIRVNS